MMLRLMITSNSKYLRIDSVKGICVHFNTACLKTTTLADNKQTLVETAQD